MKKVFGKFAAKKPDDAAAAAAASTAPDTSNSRHKTTSSANGMSNSISNGSSSTGTTKKRTDNDRDDVENEGASSPSGAASLSMSNLNKQQQSQASRRQDADTDSVQPTEIHSSAPRYQQQQQQRQERMPLTPIEENRSSATLNQTNANQSYAEQQQNNNISPPHRHHHHHHHSSADSNSRRTPPPLSPEADDGSVSMQNINSSQQPRLDDLMNTINELKARLRESEQNNERLRLELDNRGTSAAALDGLRAPRGTTTMKHSIAVAKQLNQSSSNANFDRLPSIIDDNNKENNEFMELSHPADSPNDKQKEFPRSSELLKSKKQKKIGVSAETTEASRNVQLTVVEKDFKTKQLLKQAITHNDFLKHLDKTQIVEMIEYMYPVDVPTSECYIIRQNEEGNHLYVLASGSVTVNKDGAVVGSMQPGTAFGEIAILYNCRRRASVISNEPCKLWVLDRLVYQKLMIKTHTDRQNEMISLLALVPVLSKLPGDKMRKLADAFEVDFYSAGDYIIRQNETGDYFYILVEGEVNVTQQQSPPADGGAGENVINTLKRGDFFGEKALVSESRRSCSVIATTDVECLTLHRDAFKNLIGDIRDITDKQYSTTSSLSSQTSLSPTSPSRAAPSSAHSASDPVFSPSAAAVEKNVVVSQTNDRASETTLSPPSAARSTAAAVAAAADQSRAQEKSSVASSSLFRTRPKPMEFKSLKTLGVGAFGRVTLVQHRDIHDQVFALKMMKKAYLVKMSQQTHAMSEKNTLLECHSPFIVKLYCTMTDAKCLYLVSEFIPGGELWAKLRDANHFDEATVRFYGACALLAIGYLHERQVIYRDLKPENVLLDARGYGKLVDFGFAKHVQPHKKTWTFCGTPQYLAPEIILNKGHDQAVDFYELGIFLYELNVGRPPFESGSGNQLDCYHKVLRGINAAEFPRFMSRACISLVTSLSQLNPVERIGNQKGGINDIKKHKFFQGFDWSGLASQTMTAPIQPKVRGPTDSSNFDETFPDDDEVAEDDTTGWDRDF